jgi:glycogen operon protein
VGSFIGDSWQEWNGRFRDDVRRFLKSDAGMVPQAALRALGSPDIYGHEEREAEQSVNFITCHDGFTLADLVAYNRKHNEANGEGNRDGADDNASWNCGVEGPSDDPAVRTLRRRQMRNFLAFLLISIGTPMLSMGDEVARSQQGNNNPYCLDNETTWFDWDLCRRHADLRRFVKQLIAARMHPDRSTGDHDLPSLNDLLSQRRIEWHGVTLHQPDWSHDSRSFALSVTGEEVGFRLHFMANAWWQPLDFELPAADGIGSHWRRWIDTALESPHDIAAGWEEGTPVTTPHYRVEGRSLAVLLTKLP